MSKELPSFSLTHRVLDCAKKDASRTLLTVGSALMLGGLGGVIADKYYQHADGNEVQKALQAQGYKSQEVDQAKHYAELLRDDREKPKISRARAGEILAAGLLAEEQVKQKHKTRDNVTVASASASMLVGALMLVGGVRSLNRRVINKIEDLLREINP